MVKIKDPFEVTVGSYCDPQGAEAYVVKELPRQSERKQRAFALLDGVDVKGWKILDVGCGFGRDVGEFRACGAEAWGVDVSEALLSRAREKFGPWFRVDDVRGAGDFVWPGPFDLVWCSAVLVHVPREHLEPALARMWGVLKPGGRLAIWTKVGEGERMMENLGRKFPRVMVYYSLDEILAPLRRRGAFIEKADDHGGESLHTRDRLLCVRARKPDK